MTNRLIPLAVLLLFAALGCETVRDVTNDPAYQTDYKKGAVFQTTNLLFIRDDSLLRVSHGSTPESVEAFSRERAAWNAGGFSGYLLPNTKLRVDNVVFRNSYGIGDWYTVKATVLDGEHAGRVVNLAYLHDESNSRGVPRSNPKYLRPAN